MSKVTLWARGQLEEETWVGKIRQIIVKFEAQLSNNWEEW